MDRESLEDSIVIFLFILLFSFLAIPLMICYIIFKERAEMEEREELERAEGGWFNT